MLRSEDELSPSHVSTVCLWHCSLLSWCYSRNWLGFAFVVSGKGLLPWCQAGQGYDLSLWYHSRTLYDNVTGGDGPDLLSDFTLGLLVMVSLQDMVWTS
jgi:hypothetical protein